MHLIQSNTMRCWQTECSMAGIRVNWFAEWRSITENHGFFERGGIWADCSTLAWVFQRDKLLTPVVSLLPVWHFIWRKSFAHANITKAMLDLQVQKMKCLSPISLFSLTYFPSDIVDFILLFPVSSYFSSLLEILTQDLGADGLNSTFSNWWEWTNCGGNGQFKWMVA